MGEGAENEIDIMPYIDSVSIACGGHYGDRQTILSTMLSAQNHGLKMGLHPSFPDKINFGRLDMLISIEKLRKALVEQIDLGCEVASSIGVQITHIKPHGALYNKLAFDSELCQMFLDVIGRYGMGWEIYGLSESLFLKMSIDRGYSVMHEVFADRWYNSNKTLVSRAIPGAIISDMEQMKKQTQSMLQHREFLTFDGQMIKLKADTICIHSDSKDAAIYAQLLSQYIKDTL